MSSPLTAGIEQRLVILFEPNNIEPASSLLTDECGTNISKHPQLLERIRFAVLKLSRGDLNALQQAIDLAKIDWRDALVGAGFGDDAQAHESWWPSRSIVPPTS